MADPNYQSVNQLLQELINQQDDAARALIAAAAVLSVKGYITVHSANGLRPIFVSLTNFVRFEEPASGKASLVTVAGNNITLDETYTEAVALITG